MDIVHTGVKGLDELLGGGLPFGSITTLGGETGTGKTILATQFLYNGATLYDEPGLFISFDERKNTLYGNMKKLGFDLLKLEKEKKFLFIEFPPYEIEQFITQEEVVHEFIDELGIERLVLDPITSFGLSYEREDKRRFAMQKLFEKFRKWLCTTIVIAEGAQSLVPATKFEPEKLSDGFIFMHSELKGHHRVHGIEVVKMRGMKHSRTVASMDITENGTVVHPRTQV